MHNSIEKTLLSERAVYHSFVDKRSHIDFDTLNNHLISQKNNSNLESQDVFSWQNYYYRSDFNKHLQWSLDYIYDHFNADYVMPNVSQLETIEGFYFTYTNVNESLHSHNLTNHFDLINSPDIISLLTTSKTDNDSFIEFEYNDGRKKNLKYRIKLEQRKFIIFTNNMNYKIIKNNNSEPLVNFCMRYKYL